MIQTHRSPDVGQDWAAEAARATFDLSGTLQPLPGDRDLNFLLSTDAGERWVVKVTSADEPDDTLDFECALMEWLAEEGSVAIPAMRQSRSGKVLARIADGDRSWRVRVLEYLPGRTLASVRPRDFGLLEDLGRRVGALDRDLESYSGKPPVRPNFQWALARAGLVIEAGLQVVPEPRRTILASALHGFSAAEPVFATFPTQVIHGDVNDHNVLVSAVRAGPRRATGILDFGDLHAAPAVFDLAITMAYGALDARDPIQAAARIVAGYHEARPLSEDDVIRK